MRKGLAGIIYFLENRQIWVYFKYAAFCNLIFNTVKSWPFNLAINLALPHLKLEITLLEITGP